MENNSINVDYIKIDTLKKEVFSCVEYKLYYSALITSFCVIEYCAFIDSPEESGTGKRVKNWLSKYFNFIEFKKIDENIPSLSGELIYQIRCSLVHEASLSLNLEKLEDKIDEIEYWEFNLLDDVVSCYSCCEYEGKKVKQIKINIKQLTKELWWAIDFFLKRQSELKSEEYLDYFAIWARK